jgi:hypothetical protein
VANRDSHDISILLNNGDGTFAAHVTYGAGNGPWSVAIGDLDGDVDLDLAVANELSDDVSMLRNDCTPPCHADLDGSGEVAFGDLLDLLAAWGPCGTPCPEDLDDDGTVAFLDLIEVLGSWGPCRQPGACCLDDGSCEQAVLLGGGDCWTQGGAYQGDDTPCATVTCPQPGACCLDDGSCTFVVRNDCTAVGGAYQGDGVSCAATDCPQPGACCLEDGSCFYVPPETCDALDGQYQGGGTACESVVCP